MQNAFQPTPNKSEASPERPAAAKDFSAHLYVSIQQPELLKYDLESLDRLQINNLQERNLELALFWADPYKPGSVCQRTFYAPNCVQGKAVWDVCYFNYESQIEVGAFVTGEPAGLEFRKTYERLRDFVARRTDAINFKQELCKLFSFFVTYLEFDTQGMFRMDDFWLSKEAFLQNLSAFELRDRLLEHEERRAFKSGKNEQAMAQSLKKLDRFLDLFASRLMNIYGFVTYKNFERFAEDCCDDYE